MTCFASLSACSSAIGKLRYGDDPSSNWRNICLLAGAEANLRRDGSSQSLQAAASTAPLSEAAPGAAARQIKAAAVEASSFAGASRKLTGARASAAARTRSHSSWGKRHVDKEPKAAFKAARNSTVVKAGQDPIVSVTKVLVLRPVVLHAI